MPYLEGKRMHLIISETPLPLLQLRPADAAAAADQGLDSHAAGP